MQELDDNALLREYVRHGSEEAFATLVARHINKVYSVALRQTGNPHHAEEITQAVFAILARKAAQLSKRVILSGWLYQSARLTAVTFVRSEIRRARREEDAYMQRLLDQDEAEAWPQIAPLLDAAMAGLNETDRHAVVLRFFDGKSMREVGTTLGASEDAAKMRVNRAVERMRVFFTKRGIVLSSAVLTAAISANSVQAAPAILLKTTAAIAITKGAAASASTSSLVSGAMKVMAWAQAKMALIASAAVLLAAGATVTLVTQSEARVDFPASAWKFAGYGTPMATIETLAWAVNQTNGSAILACLSPDCQREFRQLAAQTKPRTSAEQFLLRLWGQQLKGRSGIRILKTEAGLTNQVLLDLALQGGSKSGDRWVKLQKFGDEWKVEDFDPKGKNGRTGMDHPNAEYGGIGLALGLDEAHHAVRITEVLPNSAAAQVGLKAGLIVLKISGTSTTGKTLAECVFLGRGRVGTKVALEVWDPTLNQTNVVELARRKLRN